MKSVLLRYTLGISYRSVLSSFCSVESGNQDIILLEEWHDECKELNTSLNKATQQINNLKKASNDPVKLKKQNEDFNVCFFFT